MTCSESPENAESNRPPNAVTCPRGRWFWPWHRWCFDGPLPGLVNPGYMRRCRRCGVRQEVVDA